jgi:hypothetical protein
MNNFTLGKIESCIEISNGDHNEFKRLVKKTTSLTDIGFHSCGVTDVAYKMMKRKEKIEDIIKAVI